MRVAHVISSLGVGGAESMLVALTGAHARLGWSSMVVSLTDEGVLAADARRNGSDVKALGMHRGVPNPLAIPRLAKLLRLFRPDVVQTWMYHSDLIGGVAAVAIGGLPVVWGVHHTDMDPGRTKRTTRLTRSLCARLSFRLPSAIVCCSESSRRIHRSLGYAENRMEVICNGFDLARFAPNSAHRERIRSELKLAGDVQVVGLPARFDPQKDHETFCAAALALSRLVPSVHFVLCGVDITWANQPLAMAIRSRGLEGRFSLLGVRRDMPAIYNAVDLVTLSSSYGEAFPMVLGEAMSCGKACVSTDVGDADDIIGDTGVLVPIRDADALASGWARLLKETGEERARRSAAARERIVSQFSMARVSESYAHLYQRLSGSVVHPR